MWQQKHKGGANVFAKKDGDQMHSKEKDYCIYETVFHKPNGNHTHIHTSETEKHTLDKEETEQSMEYLQTKTTY